MNKILLHKAKYIYSKKKKRNMHTQKFQMINTETLKQRSKAYHDLKKKKKNKSIRTSNIDTHFLRGISGPLRSWSQMRSGFLFKLCWLADHDGSQVRSAWSKHKIKRDSQYLWDGVSLVFAWVREMTLAPWHESSGSDAWIKFSSLTFCVIVSV